ncbi:MAG: diguanylate cyclase [Phycisphaeraceae bacterium]
MSVHHVPRLLLVEDDPDAADLICETLRDHFGCDCVRRCSTIAQALAVDTGDFDMVLSDINLPDGTGLELLEQLLQRRADLPVVFVTGESVLEYALTAIRRGAYDYIVKAGDYLFAIPVAVEKNLAIWKTKQYNQELEEQLKQTLDQVRIKNQQLEEAVAQLETMAATDPLTGLANRRAFGQAMERCFAECSRHGRDLACIMTDLDAFKELNDTLGHQCGDELLQRAASVLEANCRRSDVAGRFGGDEFIVLLPDTDLQRAQHVATRILEQFKLAAQALLGQTKLAGRLSMSIGLATLCDSRPASPEQLIAHADHALYLAKQAGKTRVMVYRHTAGPDRHPAQQPVS